MQTEKTFSHAKPLNYCSRALTSKGISLHFAWFTSLSTFRACVFISSLKVAMFSSLYCVYVLLNLVVFFREAGEYPLLMWWAKTYLGAKSKHGGDLESRFASFLWSCLARVCITFIFCLLELQPTFTAEPPDPFTVLEGNNITLEWSYDLGGGSFRRIELRVINPPDLVAEVDTGGLVPLDNDYTGRLQVNVTATQASITILEANRTDSKDYVLQIHQLGSPTAGSEVTILVQCKYKFNT